jgi:hypothetical protein
MEITHEGKRYKVTQMANQSFWRLTRVDSPREGFTVNRDWLVNHGYWLWLSRFVINMRQGLKW